MQTRVIVCSLISNWPARPCTKTLLSWVQTLFVSPEDSQRLSLMPVITKFSTHPLNWVGRTFEALYVKLAGRQLLQGGQLSPILLERLKKIA
jgi:hypothetical protein